MKVIFLDFDGVVVLPDQSFSIMAISRLNTIALRTGAVICFSTSWRYSHDTAELRDMLRANGLANSIPVIGSVPDLSAQHGSLWVGAVRGSEISSWLKDHPEVESYVILDDCAEICEPLGDRLVETTLEIEERNVKQAIEILEWPL